jgi:hypothetical protein
MLTVEDVDSNLSSNRYKSRTIPCFLIKPLQIACDNYVCRLTINNSTDSVYVNDYKHGCEYLTLHGVNECNQNLYILVEQ